MYVEYSNLFVNGFVFLIGLHVAAAAVVITLTLITLVYSFFH